MTAILARYDYTVLKHLAHGIFSFTAKIIPHTLRVGIVRSTLLKNPDTITLLQGFVVRNKIPPNLAIYLYGLTGLLHRESFPAYFAIKRADTIDSVTLLTFLLTTLKLFHISSVRKMSSTQKVTIIG
jgi:hypothetical protein